jgi:hypothetical protein
MIISSFRAFNCMRAYDTRVGHHTEGADMELVLQYVHIFLESEPKTCVYSGFHLQPRYRKQFSVAYFFNHMNTLPEVRVHCIEASFKAYP